MFSILMIFLVQLSGCGGNSDNHQPAAGEEKAHSHGEEMATNVPAAFRSQLADAINVYFDLKNALVAEDVDLAVKKAVALKSAVSNIDMSTLSGEMLVKWKNTLNDLQSNIESQTSKKDIATQRESFLPLSTSIIKCASDFGPFDMPVYVQHCPMAFNNAGGDWLSNAKEVTNPYFGEGMMHHCGTITETIAQK